MSKSGKTSPFWDRETCGEPPACEWPDCDQLGEYRAPRSRDHLQEYRWFCLEHVRIYNRSWNYYAGMSETEIERDMRYDVIWNRPTWKFGETGRGERNDPFSHFADPLGVFRDAMGATDGAASPGDHAPPVTVNREQEKALQIFELSLPVTEQDIRSRYKSLVKIHHPDANNGDKQAEERFKQLSQAYRTLLERFGDNVNHT